ncbi:MAG: hypothetical protein JXR81_03870 [Candidatus Goldbacteria bacterium]|nr:hypothetical protein [Candidatus Goldiibacteriota bacterium]
MKKYLLILTTIACVCVLFVSCEKSENAKKELISFHKNGNEYIFKIKKHGKMNETTVKLTSDKTDLRNLGIKEMLILDSAGKTRQSIDISDTKPVSSVGKSRYAKEGVAWDIPLMFEDYNFDGNIDLGFMESMGASVDSDKFWLYEPATGKFENSKELSENINSEAIFNYDKKIIKQLRREGGNTWSVTNFTWEKGKLKILESFISTPSKR